MDHFVDVGSLLLPLRPWIALDVGRGDVPIALPRRFKSMHHQSHHKLHEGISHICGPPTLVKRGRKVSNMLLALACMSIIGPVVAFDNQMTITGTYPTVNMGTPIHHSRSRLDVAFGFLLLVMGSLRTTTTSLLGPLMGISSVLWFVLRNDTAVDPKYSFGVFGFWALVSLMYITHQKRRVVHDKLYVLLASTFGGICLCVVALVQNASIQGGLVTAVPPCISFGAYCVAFFFPSRGRNPHMNTVDMVV